MNIKDSVTLLRIQLEMTLEAEKGNEWDTVVVPKGAFDEIDTLPPQNFKIFESAYIEKGRIIFINSKKMEGGYK